MQWLELYEQIDEARSLSLRSATDRIRKLQQETEASSINYLRLLREEALVAIDWQGDQAFLKLVENLSDKAGSIAESSIKKALILDLSAWLNYLDYESGDYETALRCASEAVDLVKEFGTEREIVSVMMNYAFVSSLQDQDVEARLLEGAKALAQSWGNEALVHETNIQLSYLGSDDPTVQKQRIENLLQSSQYFREKGNNYMLVNADFAVLYNSGSNDPESLLSRIDEQIASAEALEFNVLLLNLYRKKAHAHERKAEFETAVSVCQKAIEKAVQLESPELAMWVKADMGWFLVQENRPEKYGLTELLLLETLEEAKGFGDEFNIAYLSLSLAETYVRMEAFEKAEEHIKFPLEWFGEQGGGKLRRARFLQSKIEYGLGRIEDAYSMIEDLYVETRDKWSEEYQAELLKQSQKLNTAALDNKMKLLEIKSELDESRLSEQTLLIEAQLLRADTQQSRILVLTLVIGIAAVSITALAYFFIRRNQVNRQLRGLASELEREKHALELEHERYVQANSELSEANAHLKEIDEERKTILGIAAHDMKNPLGAIESSLELLKMDLEGDEPLDKESLAELVELSEEGTVILRRLIENIMNARRTEKHSERMSLRWVDPLEVVEQTIQLNSQNADSKGISVHLEKADRFEWHCDVHSLREVLDNLISNSIKYSFPDAQVRVRMKWEDESGLIEIHDGGPGLQESDYEKLFQAFAKLSARPTGGEVSTGLGLSSVKHLTDAMNGEVKAENHPEGGAVFSLVMKSRLLEQAG
ncbi:sensor histidine kinase [Pelagicoccus mobilis]